MARLLGSQGQSEVCKSEPKRTNPQRPPRKRQRKQKNSNAAESTCEDNICNNMARIKRRVKYLLTRVNLEQNYIDAYSAEGWKGQRLTDFKQNMYFTLVFPCMLLMFMSYMVLAAVKR